ncbi:MAG: DNA modification methylase [Cytophagia bacterium]|nr:DNA modification methylase [Cytophagia bacterium]
MDRLIKDFVSQYSDLVSFQSNKYFPIHRWFNMVEGFSPELVRRLIGEQRRLPESVFDPFGGVATTALTCQDLGIKCWSIEANPFFYHVARTKLRTDYLGDELAEVIDGLKRSLSRTKKTHSYPKLESNTFFENELLEKWIFHQETAFGILDILERTKTIPNNYSKYADLCVLALASILVPISNVFRNGKCLSYKARWKDTRVERNVVHKMFFDVMEDILIDIRSKNRLIPRHYNYVNFMHGDSRQRTQEIPDQSLDMVITSPPYLNSRDYTDVYRLELWILGFITSFAEERQLRANALTSHVQISLPDRQYPAIEGIDRFLFHLDSMNGSLWNKNIPNMIKGYFSDMEGLFETISKKLKPGGSIYLNVSNSAYGNKICEVDKLLAEVAELKGFKTLEIRTARYISSSNQQSLKGKIRESVVVLRNER